MKYPMIQRVHNLNSQGLKERLLHLVDLTYRDNNLELTNNLPVKAPLRKRKTILRQNHN
jgi:hypothetical protein